MAITDNAMSTQRTQEVLYESEAALRLVDQELSQLRASDDDVLQHDADFTGSAELLAQASAQMQSLVDEIRQGRACLLDAVVEVHGTPMHTSTNVLGLANGLLGNVETRLLAIARLCDQTGRPAAAA